MSVELRPNLHLFSPLPDAYVECDLTFLERPHQRSGHRHSNR